MWSLPGQSSLFCCWRCHRGCRGRQRLGYSGPLSLCPKERGCISLPDTEEEGWLGRKFKHRLGVVTLSRHLFEFVCVTEMEHLSQIFLLSSANWNMLLKPSFPGRMKFSVDTQNCLKRKPKTWHTNAYPSFIRKWLIFLFFSWVPVEFLAAHLFIGLAVQKVMNICCLLAFFGKISSNLFENYYKYTKIRQCTYCMSSNENM